MIGFTGGLLSNESVLGTYLCLDYLPGHGRVQSDESRGPFRALVESGYLDGEGGETKGEYPSSVSVQVKG